MSPNANNKFENEISIRNNLKSSASQIFFRKFVKFASFLKNDQILTQFLAEVKCVNLWPTPDQSSKQ